MADCALASRPVDDDRRRRKLARADTSVTRERDAFHARACLIVAPATEGPKGGSTVVACMLLRRTGTPNARVAVECGTAVLT